MMLARMFLAYRRPRRRLRGKGCRSSYRFITRRPGWHFCTRGLVKLRQRYGLPCEVVYIDDGSADATLSIARGLGADAIDVQVVSLSRNFGKEAALMAGLDHARRGAVLFMDGDG